MGAVGERLRSADACLPAGAGLCVRGPQALTLCCGAVLLVGWRWVLCRRWAVFCSLPGWALSDGADWAVLCAVGIFYYWDSFINDVVSFEVRPSAPSSGLREGNGAHHVSACCRLSRLSR